MDKSLFPEANEYTAGKASREDECTGRYKGFSNATERWQL